MNCKLVLSLRSQFFHNLRFFSNQAKLRSTTQRLGITLNMFNSLRLAICTVTRSPKMSRTPLANWFSGITAVAQQAFYLPQGRLAARQGPQRTVAVGHLRRCHRNSMGQPLCIHGDVPFDPRDLLPGVIAFLPGRVRVLHALRVHDQERA
ncbi:MAG: hypothetical protein JNIBNLAF_00614 [Nitrosomonas europaea]|nr:hypothetical protein [Nitrosomonas europaea]